MFELTFRRQLSKPLFIFLISCFLTISTNIYAAADSVGARDEATCIYDLATALVQKTAWNHLTFETRVYFSGPVTGAKTYTIFATSAQNTPRDYKIQFRATWTTTPIGSCSYSATPFSISSSANETVAIYQQASMSNPTQVDPARFPLDPGARSEIAAGFSKERAYGERVQAGPDAAPARSGVQRDASGNVTLSAETLSLLASHGTTSLVEGGGALALQKYARPTGRTMRFVRRAGQVGLVADGAYRMYLVVGQGTNPSYVPLYNVTREGAGNLWDLWAPGSHINGVLQLPGNYVSTFYDGNLRLSAWAIAARDALRRRAVINARLEAIRAELRRTDLSTYRRDSLVAERQTLENDLLVLDR